MNAIGLLLVWTALQVSVFCLAGIVLYLVARRRNPATGAWAAGAALAMAVGISALALSPWPRWWSIDSAAATSVATPDTDDREEPTDERPDERLTPGMLAGAIEKRVAGGTQDAIAAEGGQEPRHSRRSFIAGLRSGMSRSSAALSTSSWQWPAWLALAVAVGCAVAFARLLVALAAARRYRAQARPLTDPSLVETLQQIRRQIGCARRIELREAAGLGSPATMGCLRPVVILPADWSTWSVDELRAVLSHEVAHVVRGDFTAALLAQLGVAVHFYNPLVHWLARRLRLEQEMAADVWGAQVLGNRQLYLTALAQMALRTSDPPIAWAMRPFLPTRGTLLRRVEMLHREKMLPQVALSHGRRTALAAAMLAVGCLIAGFRGPQTSGVATAAPPANASPNAAAEPFNLDYVPNDAQVVLAMRPADLMKIKAVASLKPVLEGIGLFKPLDLPLEEIEEFKFVAAGDLNAPAKQGGVLVLRSRRPHDWSKLGTYFTGKAEKAIGAGQEYYRAVEQKPGGFQLQSYWLPDDRTIVIAPPERITDTFSLRGPVNQPAWAPEWEKVAVAPAALMIRAPVLQPFVTAGGGGLNMAELAEAAFFRGSEVDGEFQVTGTLDCRSREAAARIAVNLQATMDFFAKQVGAGPGIPIIMAQLIKATKIEAKDATVRSLTQVSPRIADEFARQIEPARAAARRNVSANKMKQLGIALHNYHDVRRRFPSAVVIGPDGKTPHSWRVELLPFLEMKKDLYDRYKMDEPWDSEHNRKLIAEGADLFSVPMDKPNGDCSYFLITGPGTVFDPAQGPSSVRNIVDGTSKTIGMVEAKRSIPWTKPEDIEYDPDKPLPKLGGFFEGGYHVGAMDASVHFLPDETDEATLRALFSRGGREPVAIP
ncbi:MAG: M56 family metallopeptidase [Pirellulales bacterium]